MGHKPLLAVWTGRLPISKNVEASVALAEDGRLRMKVGRCYRNCFRAVQELPEFHDSTYVEGIAYLDDGFQVEHAWLEREDEIIDPTLPTKRAVYFPGLRFEGVAGLGEAMATPRQRGERDLPFFRRFGFGGCLSPEFAAARQAADRMFGRTVYEGQLQLLQQPEDDAANSWLLRAERQKLSPK